MTLYLFNFNNYYNRIVKRYETIDEYPQALEIYKNINFIPNDGIYSEQILNYNGPGADYLIVYDADNEEIDSRWYITESTRLRNGQYKLSLIRDVIADWYNEVVNTPMFIEKAFVNAGDPAIFNNEAMSYNQIKTSEKLLKDFSNCAWIVGYLAKNAPGATLKTPSPETPEINYPNGFESYTYNAYTEQNGGKFYANPSNYCARLNTYFEDAEGTRSDFCFAWDKNANSIEPFNPDNRTGVYFGRYMFKKTEQEGYKSNTPLTNMYSNHYGLTLNGQLIPFISAFEGYIKTIDWNDLTTYPTSVASDMEYQALLNENGKIIKDGENYYKIEVYAVGKDSVYTPIPLGNDLRSKMENVKGFLSQRTTNGYQFLTNSPSNPTRPYLLETECTSYRIRYIPLLSVNEMEIQIPDSGARISCTDQPYDIFAIPFGRTVLNDDIMVNTNSNFADYTQKLFGQPLTDVLALKSSTTKEAAYNLAQLIIKEFGKENLYDIQLLPFCPINRKYHSTEYSTYFLPGANNLDTKTVNPLWYEYTQAQGQKVRSIVSYMWWLDSSQFSIELSENISVPSDPLEFKVKNETEVYRLVSPNYQGQFEFSATKNGGIYGWTIDCAYKPFQPYIKIAPLFGRLYGEDFNDARGLILGGDFSLSQISDAWVSYQNNNKYFQNQFDRQIENMEVNNSVQRELEKWNAITGTVSGAATGALIGHTATLGNPLGSLIGGAASGILSGLAGSKDIQLNERLRGEALDYTKDQFGYQLQNIKALPYSLNKVSTFNPNYKLFPVLEYYTCTDIEKEALKNKIKYNGMTIMRIGTIDEFIDSQEQRYIKGKLIRLEGISEDFHVVNAIANELNQGVFI